MKGILEKTFKGWVVNTDTACYQLHEADCERLDEMDAGFFGKLVNVEFELVRGYDSIFKITKPFAKIDTPMIDRLKVHFESTTPEQFGEELDEVAEWFKSEIGEDGLNVKEFDNYADDMKAYVKQYENEEELRKEGAIDFAKWLAENDWMSTWVVDKWMWENVNDLYPPNHKHHGMYYTEEELYEIYSKSI